MGIVQLLELFTGFGPPDEGEGVRGAANHFAAVHNQPSSAFPDASWQGAASNTYARQNSGQRDSMQSLTDLDKALSRDVKCMAEQVANIRFYFGVLTGLLAAAYICYVGLMEWECPLEAGTLALRASALGVLAGLGMIIYVNVHS